MKKFFAEVKEWFADVVDHMSLVIAENRIENLKEELEWEFNSVGRQKIIAELDLHSGAHNFILSRIRARDARHQKAMAH